MKIGEFLAGLAGETAVEIIHDPKNDYIKLVSDKGVMIVKRNAAYRLLGGLYVYLGLEPYKGVSMSGGPFPCCDWFGYDGEQAQCSAQGTKEIDGRRLCPAHFEIVKTKDAWKRTHIY